MNDRQRAMALLNYRPYDRLPVVHFGFWRETLQKWEKEGHITREEATGWDDGNPLDGSISEKLGFDFNWFKTFAPHSRLFPCFDSRVTREFPDGSRHVLNEDGVIVLSIPGVVSIPAEIAHTLVDRASWEEHYKPRYQWSPDRVTQAPVLVNDRSLPFAEGGLEFLCADQRDYPYGLFCGSLYGQIRDVLGVEGSCMMALCDDPDLMGEIIETVADMSYRNVRFALDSGAKFDFAHFWEDICFKNGPLISPAFFGEQLGPHYKRITDLLHQHGINIVSLDCDGMIDHLLPIWLENGVNTMFPIEVGTWNASIAPWREKYGRELRGVGGMNKTVFARDRAAVNAEIERLKPLVELGGFIPCPDHRIAPDADWELVRYYCDRMREVFG